LARGEINADQRIVCVMSGAGFKDMHLAEDRVRAVERHESIPFDVESIREAMKEHNAKLA
jgi:hypothetical protein